MNTSDFQILRPLKPHEFSGRVRALFLSLLLFIASVCVVDERFRSTVYAVTEHTASALIAAVDNTTVPVQYALVRLSLIK